MKKEFNLDTEVAEYKELILSVVPDFNELDLEKELEDYRNLLLKNI